MKARSGGEVETGRRAQRKSAEEERVDCSGRTDGDSNSDGDRNSGGEVKDYGWNCVDGNEVDGDEDNGGVDGQVEKIHTTKNAGTVLGRLDW